MSTHKDPPILKAPAARRAVREARWENEGGATLPPAHVVAAASVRAGKGPRPDQPRLYADLLAEADRQRRAADTVLVRGMIAVRDPSG